MLCGDTSRKSQCKDQRLGTLETTYLVEMNIVELVSERHGKQSHKNERMFCCLILRNIINGRGVLESVYKCKENNKY